MYRPAKGGNPMRLNARVIPAITLMIFASVAARAQVEMAAARANRPL